ncbi:LCP family glycopolymer transferase [Galactobacter valiniphilus]|uniref:LCP family glycopolymer transferase n=1 Tax=Galactobacter valiniphilus TaxID=2676122 RepID=UPI003734DBED
MSPSLLNQDDPLRHPEESSAPTRTKRAWTLWLLTLLVPGGAQVVAGNKRLGRAALTVTVACWALIVAAVVLLLVKRSWLISLVADSTFQLVGGIALALLALGWIALFLNTLAIIRPGLLAPGMKAIVPTAVVAAMVLTSGSLGYGSYVLLKGRDALSGIFASGPPIEAVDGRYNILVMGGDAGSDRIGLRPDSSAVWSIDAASGRTAVISIPRNLQNVPFPNDSPMHKIYPSGFNCGDECIFNAIYPTVAEKHADLYPGQDAGAEATKEAASAVTGLTVQAYVVVDMGGFKDLIDAMGGVTITSGGWVPYNTKKPWPGTTIKTHWFAPGEHHFTGNQALWFARSRDFTTDYHRIRRQQCLQQAMINQFTPQTLLTKFTGIMDTGKQIVHTDLPQGQLGDFVNLADMARKNAFLRLTLGAPDFGTAADKFSTFPDYELIHTRVDALVEKATDAGAKAAKEAQASKKAQASQKASDSAKASGSASSSAKASSTPKASSDTGSTVDENDGESTLKNHDDVPTTQPDGSPIDEEYLVRLEKSGLKYNLDLISQIAQNNDACTAG